MSSFDWKKNVEDSIKDGLIITATTTGICFCIKSGKCKTAKGIPRCHGYHKTCPWNLWESVGKRLCSLQEIDQRVMQQKLYGPLRAVKLLFNTRKAWRLKSRKFPTWKCFTSQWLKSRWDR